MTTDGALPVASDELAPQPEPSVADLSPKPPVLLLEAVSVRFGGLQALSDVTLRVNSSEIVGLIGPNGAGKTTLFNVICGFVKPTSGNVKFPAARLARSPLNQVIGKVLVWQGTQLRPSQLARAGVSRTLQGVGLFPLMTVLENVMAGGQILPHGGFFTGILALPQGVRADRMLRDEALRMLDRFGVASFAARLPGEIPYGVAKKVAIARALMCGPNLLLLDEPASGLDESELDEFAAHIVELRREMAVLLVEHDMGFVMPLVDRLIVLDFGEVIATGRPAEVQRNPAVIEAYLGVEQ